MTKPMGRPDWTIPASFFPMVVPFRRGVDGALTEVGEGILYWTGYTGAEIKAHPEVFESVLVKGENDPAGQFQIRHRKTGIVRRIGEWGLEGEGVWMDLSFGERLRARLWEGLWNESLTQLTKGFVHDLNNILAGIGSLSELSLMELAADHPMLGNLKMLKENTYKATRLTEQLTRLLHARNGRPNYHDLNQVVREVCAALKPALPRNIECVLELADESLPVHVDGRDLQQVMMSLAWNGVGAIEGKGKMVWRTAVHERMPESVMLWGERIDGACVSLTVEDSGAGLDPGLLGNLVAMDYTTKEGRGGMGLGLAHAAAFCQSAGGAMSVISEAGRGGVVVLWLPRAELS